MFQFTSQCKTVCIDSKRFFVASLFFNSNENIQTIYYPTEYHSLIWYCRLLNVLCTSRDHHHCALPYTKNILFYRFCSFQLEFCASKCINSRYIIPQIVTFSSEDSRYFGVDTNNGTNIYPHFKDKIENRSTLDLIFGVHYIQLGLKTRESPNTHFSRG